MDTLKAVLVLVLGGYILLGEGPAWLGDRDDDRQETDERLVDVLPQPNETGDAPSGPTPTEIPRFDDLDDPSCAALIALGAGSAPGSLRLVAQMRNPDAGARTEPDPSRRDASAPSTPGADTPAVPSLDECVLPSGAQARATPVPVVLDQGH